MAKKKQPAKFIARKQRNSAAVNFLAFVAGMATSLTAGLAIWNHFVTPAQLQRNWADANSGNDDSDTFSPTRINIRDYDQLLAHGSVEQLETLLMKLNQWNSNSPLAIQVDANQKRIDVANQMLKQPLTASQRNLAIDAKIGALSAVYGLDLQYGMQLPDVGANLRDAASAHLADPNRTIARNAHLAIIKVEAFDFIKDDQSHFNPKDIVKRMVGLLQKYPDDKFVLSNVKLILYVLAGYDNQLTIQVMRGLAAHASEFQSDAEQQFFRELHDGIIIAETNFSQLLNDPWVNGKAGQRELLDIAIALAGNINAGNDVLQKVDSAANWFEQIDQLDDARKIYQAMLDSVDQRDDRELRERTLRAGENGLRRCDLINHQLKFNGSLVLGGELDGKKLENQVVVVIFWSINSPISLQVLKEFHFFAGDLAFKQTTVLAVSVDAKRNEGHLRLAKKYPNYLFIDYSGDQKAEQTLLEQCPISAVPQAVLVNHHGLVVDTNVPFDELKSSTEYLSINRFENP